MESRTDGPAHYPHKPTEQEGLIEVASACVRRMLEIGLPEHFAFLARDVIAAHIENFVSRRDNGEWARK